ncbi:hypothetical protein EKN06_15400 [Croceicoccus ponticola]|uniref:Sarcosine oxidase subunit gamma n=1 Tax=Croceicoccus ponticola TaxID=2217664 RepID=A0A437GTY9_9SPHN|nr:hypothetical protein [Croceicoccus ponticola]RVQ64626.1 hypothetical protein EKN06_15400 [Croceicoccus ponticola]
MIGAFGQYIASLPNAVLPSLAVTEWVDVSALAVMASASFAQQAGTQLADLPDGTHVLHTGIGHWLVLGQASDLNSLPSRLDGLATLFDQSAGFGILILDGRDAIRLLQKGIFVDLSRAFDSDTSCVVSVIAHVPVTVWRIASDRFGVAVPRSYAGSFWHWLEASAAADAIPLSTLG